MRCTLCPRMCGAERTETRGEGFCRMPAGPVVARAGLHMWEEPVISGTRGSGTVFFSGCTLGCVFCQNHEISAQGVGKPVTVERLGEIFRELIRQGAHNINLVTPGHFAPWVAQALEPPLPVPVVCNTGGYERVETLRLLEGKVQVYLPDMKYAEPGLAKALSGAENYFPVAAAAIREMVAQVGEPQWEGERLKKGVLIRHLILPGQIENSLKILDWIGETFRPGEVLVSLMRQYTPMPGLSGDLARKITEEEYQAVLSWMYLNDLQGFVQEAEAAQQAYIPDF